MVAYQVLMNSFIMKFNVWFSKILGIYIQYRADTSFSDSCITFTYESFGHVQGLIPDSGILEMFACEIWNPRIISCGTRKHWFWNPEFWAQGIRNPAKDWNPEESSTWNPEFTARNPESNMTVLDYRTWCETLLLYVDYVTRSVKWLTVYRETYCLQGGPIRYQEGE